MNEIIKLKENHINVIKVNGEDYISLTDMVKNIENGLSLIEKWLRNKNTIELLGVWESLNNENFNSPEFEGIKNEAGTNRFLLSVKQWTQKTNAIGIIAKTGRYNSGTYAHKDIALEFASWISPEFRLYLIKEFQRLKEVEQRRLDPDWNIKRTISKINYRIHTDAVKENLIDGKIENKKAVNITYANEADLINLAVFGKTNQQWREESGIKDKKKNIRDYAELNDLIIIANLESINAELLHKNISKKERFEQLRSASDRQKANLLKNASFKKLEELEKKNQKKLK